MSRKSAGNKADDNITEKVRKMKERQRQWLEERESAKHSDAAKSARSTSDSIQSRKKRSETTGTKTNSLAWISKDDYQVSSKKPGGKSSRGASRDLKSRESGYGSPPQFVNKRNLDSNRSGESRKSETSIAGYDDGQHKSTRVPNSPISNSMLNNQTANGAESFNNLADKVAERLQMKEQKRQELNQPVVTSHKNEKPMSNHVCSGCNNLMAAPHSPVAIIPCGHTFCQICVTEYPKCPQCQSEVFSTAPNTVMQQIIEDFRKKQEKERLHQLEEQTRKYVEEYQNLNLRCEGLADEADRILNSMESITEDMLKEKRVARKLEKENSDIQNKIKELELEYHQNEELIKESSSNCHALEKSYDEEKDKLTLIEETIKTIRNSKERAKIMIQNIAPNLKLDDTF